MARSRRDRWGDWSVNRRSAWMSSAAQSWMYAPTGLSRNNEENRIYRWVSFSVR